MGNYKLGRAEYFKQWKLKNPEKDKQYTNKWIENNPEKRKKSRLISNWKRQGILSDDWEATYNHFINCNYCEYCDKKFKIGKAFKALDHDHNINNEVNIRGVLCKSCNLIDVFDGYFKQTLQN